MIVNDAALVPKEIDFQRVFPFLTRSSYTCLLVATSLESWVWASSRSAAENVPGLSVSLKRSNSLLRLCSVETESDRCLVLVSTTS